jgi:hypothetical protein
MDTFPYAKDPNTIGTLVLGTYKYKLLSSFVNHNLEFGLEGDFCYLYWRLLYLVLNYGIEGASHLFGACFMISICFFMRYYCSLG